MQIEYENFGREVWHLDCERLRCAPMKHLAGRLTIEDGSELRLYECTVCAEQVYAGIDARRFIVQRGLQGVD